ncbi:hypothetical protein TVAG_314980 [Trichomonas vaginalis G3]|uniref:Surface antigen BspA-like n=1 Tax=Trichomonas vaginalis (strain ATCC PRA-98 / G3) TaxID=412133 RepID=A2ETT7_TRIV3|nr:hypothetical protein TVAG_314980 [Trichomonas vaginalis G3]|eukprot:XP_001316191.1 hypothetical protein [Trichomonas vaginalis G3]
MYSSVQTITIDEDNPKYVTDGKCIFTGENNKTLVTLVPTFRGEFVVPSFVQDIYEGCFRSCHVTSIVFHDNVVSIGAWAFAATDLTSLQFPQKITVVKNDMFRNCPNLLYVNLSSKTTIIETRAFKGSSNMVSLEFPPTLETIGEGAFADCQKLVIDLSKNENIGCPKVCLAQT